MVVFHEFGKQNKKVIMLIHPAAANWQLWEDYITEFEKEYHVIVPDLEGRSGIPGEHFTTIENNARQIVDQLKERNLNLHLLFGISGGANVAFKILALNELTIDYAIADAGMIYEKADDAYARPIADWAAKVPDYNDQQKQELLADLQQSFGSRFGTIYHEIMCKLSRETIWNEYYSFFTMTLPEDVSQVSTRIGLWYGEKETEKIENAAYISTLFLNTSLKIFPGYDHAGYWLGDTPGYINDIYEFISIKD